MRAATPASFSFLTRRFCGVLLLAAALVFAATAAEAGATAVPAGEAASSATGPGPWRELKLARFVVLSQLPESATREWAAEFSRFLVALDEFRPVAPADLPPLTVVLFARDEDYEPYKPAGADGKRASNVAGYFAARDTWAVIGMADRMSDVDTRETIFHEGVHWFSSADRRTLPVWLEEGIADLFSTFRVEDGQAVWGEPPAGYLAFLRNTEPMPLAEMLGIVRGDPALNEARHAGAFYARAWEFVHYLAFGNDGPGADRLAGYLRAVRGGATPAAAFRQTFGIECGEMDQLLDRYFSRAELPHARGAVAAMNEAAAGPLTIAPEELVEQALSRLAIGAGRPDLASSHLQRAIDLAPKSPAALALVAQFAAECGDDATARAAAQRAIELGSRDAAPHLVLAQQDFQNACARGELSAADARRIADAYERALEIRPHLPKAYQNLARVLTSVAEPTADDIAVLKSGRDLYPVDGEITFGLAVLAAQEGDVESARRLAREAVMPGMEISAEARQAAKAMEAMFAASKAATTDSVASLAAVVEPGPDEALPLFAALSRRVAPPGHAVANGTTMDPLAVPYPGSGDAVTR